MTFGLDNERVGLILTEAPHRPLTAVCWHWRSAVRGADDGCQTRVFRDNKQKMESQPQRSVLRYGICLSLLDHSSSLTAVWNKCINSATESEMTAREPNMTGNGERPLLPRHFQVGELLNFCLRLWAYWINWFSADPFCPLLWCGEFLMILCCQRGRNQASLQTIICTCWHCDEECWFAHQWQNKHL